MHEYLGVIITVTSIAVVMVISPGQDFAMITRNSLIYSRRAGIIGAFGISVAIWLHVMYSLAGIALIISQSEFLYSLIKYAGAFYLAYLGIKGLLHKKTMRKMMFIKNLKQPYLMLEHLKQVLFLML
ncbi:MAG: LysE family translocator [Vibrio sp.]